MLPLPMLYHCNVIFYIYIYKLGNTMSIWCQFYGVCCYWWSYCDYKTDHKKIKSSYVVVTLHYICVSCFYWVFRPRFGVFIPMITSITVSFFLLFCNESLIAACCLYILINIYIWISVTRVGIEPITLGFIFHSLSKNAEVYCFLRVMFYKADIIFVKSF